MDESLEGTFGTRLPTCPLCEAGELVKGATMSLVRCTVCELNLPAVVVGIIQGIRSLPDAAGRHACECGHPEMRRLPDDVYHCPACASEVLPVRAGRSNGEVGADR